MFYKIAMQKERKTILFESNGKEGVLYWLSWAHGTI